MSVRVSEPVAIMAKIRAFERSRAARDCQLYYDMIRPYGCITYLYIDVHVQTRRIMYV